eukprot:scaffold60130_cov62-Phaeocystis_antarctica.AAC.7
MTPVPYATWVPSYDTRAICHLGVAYDGPPYPVMIEAPRGETVSGSTGTVGVRQSEPPPARPRLSTVSRPRGLNVAK